MSCARKDIGMCGHPLLVDLSTAGTSYVSAVGGSGFDIQNPQYFTYRSYSPWRTATIPLQGTHVNNRQSPINVSFTMICYAGIFVKKNLLNPK